MEYLVILVDKDYNDHYYWFEDYNEARGFYYCNLSFMYYCKFYKCNLVVC